MITAPPKTLPQTTTASAEAEREGAIDAPRPVAEPILPPALSLALQYAIIVPTYLYTLLGPGGMVARHDWGTAALWTVAMGAFALYHRLLRPRLTTQAQARAFVAGYLALGGWVAWLATLNQGSVILFFVVVAAAAALDQRLGRRAAVAAVAIVYGEAYLRFGDRDPGTYASLLTWIAGLVFTLSIISLHGREQRARRQSEALLAELGDAHRRLQAYAEQAGELAAAQERNRLAQDLHDSVSQTLFSAGLIADVLPQLWQRRPEVARQRLEELRTLNRGALAEMRTLLLELRPAALTGMGLGDLVRQLAAAVGARAGLSIAVTVEGERTLPPDAQVAIYRIAQEALNNIAKYAEATQVDITLTLAADGVTLRVRDNGKGFDPATVPAGHLGLGIMRERAQSIGAALEVESALGQGTLVAVRWPGGEGETP